MPATMQAIRVVLRVCFGGRATPDPGSSSRSPATVLALRRLPASLRSNGVLSVAVAAVESTSSVSVKSLRRGGGGGGGCGCGCGGSC